MKNNCCLFSNVFSLENLTVGEEGGTWCARGFHCFLTQMAFRRVSMGLIVNRQMAKKLTINRQKRNIFTVNRQMSEPKLAVKFLRYPN